MDLSSRYGAQVRLLVQVLPHVATEPCFALKGGTAINLFVRDMPRLSVDIDLAYVTSEPRQQALADARAALSRISEKITGSLPGATAERQSNRDDELRVLVHRGGVQIKIEVSPVLRGTVHPPTEQDVRPEVEDAFGFAAVPVVSLPDLYGGKICAALDRQHPRDLFDVMLLLREDGLTREVFEGFLVYLISHKRPIAELLAPNRKDLQQIFELEFAGMTREEVTLGALDEAFEALLAALWRQMTEHDARFLLSLKDAAPDWTLLGLQGIDELPAVRWKLHNLERMGAEKRAAARSKLEAVLEKGMGAG